MPVVFATDAPTASGHAYNDVLGKQYEFPARYRSLVQSGDPFVYYRGSRGSADGRAVYFGTGVVGAVLGTPEDINLIAEVHDVELFDPPITAKRADGTYLETDTARGTNWANGVRRLSDQTYARILAVRAPFQQSKPPDDASRVAFASPEHARALERYSVSVAIDLLTAEFGRDAVVEMPPGNPGYDVVVRRQSGDLHVEIKGTVLDDPVFHLSEGQRRHAAALGSNFRLIVVYQARPNARTHKVAVVGGPLGTDNVALQPETWTGRVIAT